MDNFLEPTGLAGFIHHTINAIVRLAGVGMLLFGFWLMVQVVDQAWGLYRNPANAVIDNFARAIDTATHLDNLLPAPAKTEGSADGGEPAVPASSKPALRLSYFIAWPIILLLLLLIGRLALAAVKTGGELALYDVQIKRFAASLLREVARQK